MLDVTHFGAVGDGATDDGPAIQSALLAAHAQGGGRVWFPRPGPWAFHAPLVLDDLHRVTLAGSSPVLLYRGADAQAISLKSAMRIGFERMRLAYDHPGFTGAYCRTGHSASAMDAAYLDWTGCEFLGMGADRAATFLDFGRSICNRVTGCSFARAERGIVGGTHGYANVISVTDCTFLQLHQKAIVWPVESWRIVGCAFEPNLSGQSCGIDHPTHGPYAWGLTVQGCWFGDVTQSGGGPWIRVRSLGAYLTGNRFMTPGAGPQDYAIELWPGQGVQIMGNRIDAPKALHYAPGYHYGNVWTGNDFQATTVVTGAEWLLDLAALGNLGYGNRISPPAM